MKRSASLILSLLLAFSLFLSAAPALAEEPSPVITSVTVRPGTIVETLAANVYVGVDGTNLEGKDVVVYMDVLGTPMWTTPVPASGEAKMQIDAAPAAGTYPIVVRCGGSTLSTNISIAVYNTNIWEIAFTADINNRLIANFNADVSPRPGGGYNALVGIESASVSQIGDRMLKIDVDASALDSGTAVIIGGVRYSVLFPSYSFTFTAYTGPVELDFVPMIIRETAPATSWETEAMPMGNGFLGAMVFGGVESDQVLINEHTLWTGGPGANANFNGGHARTAEAYHSALQNARTEIQNRMTTWSQTNTAYIDANNNLITKDYPSTTAPLSTYLDSLKGEKNNFGNYQQLGNIMITATALPDPKVVISASNANPTFAAEQVDKLFDKNSDTKWYSAANESPVPDYPIWITWNFDRAVNNDGYSMTSAGDVPERDPKSWKLYGSANGVDYTLIDTRTDYTFAGRKAEALFPLSSRFNYRYFKLEILSTAGGAAPQLADLNVQASTVAKISATFVTSGREGNASEPHTNLFDGLTSTKWYNSTNPASSSPTDITVQYSIPKEISFFKLGTANDMNARDPNRWTLSGSDDGNNWITVHQSTSGNPLPTTRNTLVTFDLTAPVKYKYYRLRITGVRSSGSGVQLSEIQLGETDVIDTPAITYSNYERTLDIDKALATVRYTREDIGYKKEYFVSNPGNVVVVRITANQPGSVSNKIAITTPQTAATISASGNAITMTGYASDTLSAYRGDYSKGMHFAQQLKVIPTGGSMEVQGSSINVTGADSILIVMSGGTNYKQCTDDSFNYFTGVDPLNAVSARVDAAAAKSYDVLYAAHEADYLSLYDRVKLDICGMQVPSKTTTNLQLNYRGNSNPANTELENRYYETLYYQFNRYLMISCSRPGSLPANLQGIWANGLYPPWNADYHTNINVQMNYWPAQQANLAECHIPMIDYINAQVPRGTITAQTTAVTPSGGPVRGWTTYHENNIWGNTAPAISDAFYFPAGGAWISQDIWEYYRYNLDKDFLAANFETLVGAALYWVDTLWIDTRDNTLVANPSYSPEHGEYSLGASCDQAIIWELFEEVVQASEILGLQNDPRVAEIKASQLRLAGPKIGLGGQFMEWKDEVTKDVTGDGSHRHTNHLHYLHPGTRIVVGRSAEDDAFAEAMKVTLNTRGDASTGWSRAWKVNFWARLRDGDRAWKLVSDLISNQQAHGGSTYANLFDSHSPFQIDGNFGGLAGMTEMLMQSQGDSIDLLAALPTKWKTGSVYGIRARNNVELSMNWDNMVLTQATIKTVSGGTHKVKGLNIASGNMWDGESRIPFTVIDANTIVFDSEPGKTYVLSNIGRPADTVQSVAISGSGYASIPISGSASFNYSASLSYLLAGALTDNSKVSWSLDGSYPGISISQNGVLTVQSTAQSASATIIVTSIEDPSKSASKTVSVNDFITLMGIERDANSGGSHSSGEMIYDAGYVEYIANGSWLKFSNVNLGTGISSIKFYASSPNTGNFIDLLVTEPGVGSVDTATLIGTATIPNNGSWSTMTAYSPDSIAATSGVKDVYIRFRYSSSGANFLKTEIGLVR